MPGNPEMEKVTELYSGVREDGTPYRVLVVDDSMFIREYLGRFLKTAGYEIVGEASNGEEAIELYKQTKPDLVTLDRTMPGMDGIATLEEIMKIDPDATVVIVSSLGYEDIVKKAIMLGAKHYILKPLKLETTLKALKAALEKSGK